MNSAKKNESVRICNPLAGLLLLLTLWLTGGAASALAQDRTEPSVLIYINPNEYSHEVHVGYRPYFSAWISRGPMLEKAATDALKPHFSEAGLCEGNNTADVIVWLKPSLTYNPIGRYYARVRAKFYLGDGKHLGDLKATGKHDGAMGSSFVEEEVRQAYDNAMQDIARQYAADGKLHEAIRSSLAKDITKMPCAMVSMIPKP